MLIWGYPKTKAMLETTNFVFDWPGLHNQIERAAPMVATPSPYAARFTFNWLAAAGTRLRARDHGRGHRAARIARRPTSASWVASRKQLAFSLLTMACVLALAYVMNYSGATVTLGEAFAQDRRRCSRSSVRCSAGWAYS